MNQTALILLAAGESARLGEAKQLLDVAGEPLIRRVVAQLQSLDAGPVGVVIGARRAAMFDALSGLAVEVIDNPRWQEGIGTSIAAGVKWANHDDAVGSALVTLCDQPAIDAAHLLALIGRLKPEVDIVATEYAATLGVPAVFQRRCFEELCALPPDRGAKRLFNDPSLTVERIANESARIDLDTPDDVARWRKSLSERPIADK